MSTDLDMLDMWLAVVIRAAADVLGKNTYTKKPAERERLQRSAEAWLYSDNREPGSFRWVCTAINVEPDFVRGLIERARHEGGTRRRIFTMGSIRPAAEG
jgi:hypothetical protein